MLILIKRALTLKLFIFFFYGCIVGKELLSDIPSKMKEEDAGIGNIADNIKIQCKSFKKSFFSGKLIETIQPLSACQYVHTNKIADILQKNEIGKNSLKNEIFFDISIKIYFDLGNFFIFFGKAMTVFLIPLETNVVIEIEYKIQDSNKKVFISKSFRESYIEVTHWHFINSKYAAHQMIPKIVYTKIGDFQKSDILLY